jgi:hypothetical protein
MSQTQVETYKNFSIKSEDLAINSVTESNIQDDAVSRNKLKSDVRPAPFTTRGFNIPL